MNGWALFLELLLSGEGRLVHRNGPGDRHGEQEKAPDKKIKKYNETFTEYLFKICFSTSKVLTQSLGIHQIQNEGLYNNLLSIKVIYNLKRPTCKRLIQ